MTVTTELQTRHGLWESFHEGRPVRVPVLFRCDPRMILLDPALNTQGWTYRGCLEDPEVLWDVELAFQKWMSVNVHHDAPAEPEWPVTVRLFPGAEAAWLGCPLLFSGSDAPSTTPILSDRKDLYLLRIPDPLEDGIMGSAVKSFETLRLKSRTVRFEGRPVRVALSPDLTGPFTLACALRGTGEFCRDLVEDPRFAHDLLWFATRAIQSRRHAWASLGAATSTIADDALELLSPSMVREFVLPHYRELAPSRMHLCGKASHLLRLLSEEVDLHEFELGPSADLGAVRRELGPEALLIGNLDPALLKHGPPGAIHHGVRALCSSGVMESGRFILQTGGECIPGTPREHFEVAYASAQEHGRYRTPD